MPGNSSCPRSIFPQVEIQLAEPFPYLFLWSVRHLSLHLPLSARSRDDPPFPDIPPSGMYQDIILPSHSQDIICPCIIKSLNSFYGILSPSFHRFLMNKFCISIPRLQPFARDFCPQYSSSLIHASSSNCFSLNSLFWS